MEIAIEGNHFSGQLPSLLEATSLAKLLVAGNSFTSTSAACGQCAQLVECEMDGNPWDLAEVDDFFKTSPLCDVDSTTASATSVSPTPAPTQTPTSECSNQSGSYCLNGSQTQFQSCPNEAVLSCAPGTCCQQSSLNSITCAHCSTPTTATPTAAPTATPTVAPTATPTVALPTQLPTTPPTHGPTLADWEAEMVGSGGDLDATITAIASLFTDSSALAGTGALKPEVVDSGVGYLLHSLETLNVSNASALLSAEQASTSLLSLHTLVNASNASSLQKETLVKAASILELSLASLEESSFGNSSAGPAAAPVDASLATAVIETSSATLDGMGCEAIGQATAIMQRASILAQSGNVSDLSVDTGLVHVTSSSANQTATVSPSDPEELQAGQAGFGIHVIDYKGDLQRCFNTSDISEDGQQVVAGSTKNVIMSDNSFGRVSFNF